MTEPVEPNDLTNRGEPDPAIPAAREVDAMGADEDFPAHGAGVAAPADGSVSESGESSAGAPASIEDLVADLERTARERDEYLDTLRRNQAEFENARKRMIKQQSDNVDRAAQALVEQLLPVLDACDGAVRHGAAEVEPVFAALLGALQKEGLERIDPAGEPFDPNHHEAVMHEPAADANEGTVVVDVMRPGYAWKGRVIRAAMVKVRG